MARAAASGVVDMLAVPASECSETTGLMRAGKALSILRETLRCVAGSRSVPLKHAFGRILASDIVSVRDVPPHDNAAVDGYAVYHDDLDAVGDTILAVSARRHAGESGEGASCKAPPHGVALRVATGAAMAPAASVGGPDTVVMEEHCRLADGRVTLPAGVRRGANYRLRGEDIRRGDVVLRAGARLRPQDIAAAAATGLDTLPLRRPLRVAVFSSGDELREPPQPLPPAALYDSNRHGLIAFLQSLGGEVLDLGILRDEPGLIARSLGAAAARCDLLLTSGGVSGGMRDYVGAFLKSEGRLRFWRLAVKPGRPLAFGFVDATPLIALPGNPVAVAVMFMLFARPAFHILAGRTPSAPVAFPLPAAFAMSKKTGRREWLRASLMRDRAGRLCLRRYPRSGAGLISSLVASDGLVELGEEVAHVSEGDLVPFLPFSTLLW